MKRWFDFRSVRGLVTLHALGLLACAATLLFLHAEGTPSNVIGAVGGAFGGAIGCTYMLWICINGMVLRSMLRSRGYGWITWFKAVALFAWVMDRAWRLPPRDEAAAVPGYEDRIDALAALASSQ